MMPDAKLKSLKSSSVNIGFMTHAFGKVSLTLTGSTGLKSVILSAGSRHIVKYPTLKTKGASKYSPWSSVWLTSFGSCMAIQFIKNIGGICIKMASVPSNALKAK